MKRQLPGLGALRAVMAHPADVNPDGFTQISEGGRNHVGKRQRTGELLT